jgi:hypothetical protein
MSSKKEILTILEETGVLKSLVVLPIASSALILTVYQYRSWKMWQLYLGLAISILTSLSNIAYKLLTYGENKWLFNV